MLIRLRALQLRLLPHGWADLVRQLLLFGIAYAAYTLVRGMVDGRATAAFQHARALISVERTLHFFVEPSVQAWVSGSHFLMGVASWIYVNAQTSVTIGALVYLYLCHNRSFYFVRNMLLIAMVLALISYGVYPTAPPRLLPEWGFMDSVASFTGVSSHAGATSSLLFNSYAAVPSMHVAFALMMGVTLSRLARWRAVRVLWLAYPLLITFVIVVTANHFLFDAFLGAMTAAASAYGAARMARTRPNVWRFYPSSQGVDARGAVPAGASATA